MIKEELGLIGRKELAAMVIISMGAKITDMTPTIIYQDTKNAGWMVPLLSGILFMSLFIIFIKVIEKYPNKGLYELTLEVFGKKIGYTLNLGFFAIIFCALIVDSRSHIDTIGTMYYPSTPIIIIYFIFIGTSFVVARKGLQVIGVVSWLVLPYLIGTLVLLLFLVFKDLQFLRIFPILGPGIDVVAKEAAIKLSIFSDTLFFALFIPLLKRDEKFKTASTIGLVYSIIQLTIFYAVYVALFDVIGIQRLMYPFHETTRFLSVGEYFTNTETFFMALWLVGVMVKFSFYLFIACFMFAKLFSIKQIRPLLLPFATLIIFLGIIPENPVEVGFLLRENLLHIASLYVAMYIVLIWIVSRVRGG
ncbi:hypothetical protein CIB95_03800 [Lottiidibacillus patelloidae]|uniref:Uncharacterized protein n=1 Tax=Lottiidibacillus patelloidae TaxID=2670334 RepID=A0A263BYQ1_9BACI|nr:endospore germination permease [Lottiidibacillus patelloidae]OZM58702.1 hypothetical protein CIB95_03800 [Lottiidibacillus patelloidae]